MANKMVLLACTIWTLGLCVSSQSGFLEPDDINLNPMELNPAEYPPPECYNSKLRIGKRTLASTDAYRDTRNLQLIFPQAKQEFIPHFHQDECARASKLYLPYTCFKLHSPQTWELDEGYLSIKTVEREYTKKFYDYDDVLTALPQTWELDEGYLSVKTVEREYTKKFYAVINGYSDYHYDAFFDNSMAYWVDTLDLYLQQINDHDDVLTHYLGLKWTHKDLDKTFFSLLIQTPHSQRVIELISLNKPDLTAYPNLRSNFKFRETSVPRASFKQYPKDEYPWTGYVGSMYKLGFSVRPDLVPIRLSYAVSMEGYVGSMYKLGFSVRPDLVPIRLSYAVSNLDEMMSFYTEIFEASLLDTKTNVMDILDSNYDIATSYAFVQIPSAFIEIQFVQRPADYTYGAFTIERLKNALVDTHNDRITSVYCGIDRWFDNHYGYDATMFSDEDPGYLDRVYKHMVEHDLKKRVYYIDHQRDEGPWFDSDEFDIDTVDLYDLEYKLYAFDPNGQTVQMIGMFVDTFVYSQPPIYNKQWCFTATGCPGNQKMGFFNEFQKDIYVEDESDIVWQLVFGNKSTTLAAKDAMDAAFVDDQQRTNGDHVECGGVGGSRVDFVVVLFLCVSV
eukprot:CAMPEP_0197077816 /NCGR_PEP_ID=MMETSP1384-20130603/212805_1 /TAXON_ID=29189 /ORGANISM="Ammonia sp." /LENGTH=617 /DNA_ID=CAMNT_0042516681 /DNA_START=38 /DNA_END=1890 /DNA_ORIENTATION=-